MFPDHHRIKVEANYRKITGRLSFGDTFLQVFGETFGT